MIAIRVEHLSKKYTIGAAQTRYPTLRDTMAATLKRLNPALRKAAAQAPENEIWALDDVSFEIQRGEVVGVIGRNGAGKSTLLKILAHITSPTRGRVEINGRVGSLLEVGTGFHNELTGRENIYLNGAILGMKRAEINRKFDEIVAFAEIDKFLDTPVKHYSSGMYMRLAFAVAAHLEPEILLVDEVLAVGDTEFQKKCLGKMGEVAEEGRTVLFVSHNMPSIRKLCKTCMLIEQGKIALKGQIDEVIQNYLNTTLLISPQISVENILTNLPEDPIFRFKNVQLFQDRYPVVSSIGNGLPLEIIVDYHVIMPTKSLRVMFDVFDDENNLLFRSFHNEQSANAQLIDIGDYTSRAIIPKNLLNALNYELVVYATIFNERYCVPQDGIHYHLNVQSTGNFDRAYPEAPVRGKLSVPIQWETIKKMYPFS